MQNLQPTEERPVWQRILYVLPVVIAWAIARAIIKEVMAPGIFQFVILVGGIYLLFRVWKWSEYRNVVQPVSSASVPPAQTSECNLIKEGLEVERQSTAQQEENTAPLNSDPVEQATFKAANGFFGFLLVAIALVIGAGAGVFDKDKQPEESATNTPVSAEEQRQIEEHNTAPQGSQLTTDFNTALKAAEQGEADAQVKIGGMYFRGDGVPQDHQQAAAWYRKAAEQGDAVAQFLLGYLCEEGKGVPQDDKQAAAWYRKAAEQGNAGAQFFLGLMYSEGKGVPQDDKQAAAWYRKAAEQGYAAAQLRLGFMYANGKGVLQDDKQAAAWCREAADQGDAGAQFMLGAMYASGEGVPQDNLYAYAWLSLASTQGATRAAESRDMIAREFTPEQRSNAQALAAELQAKIDKQKR